MVPATTAWSKSSKVHTLSGRRSPAPLPRSTKGEKIELEYDRQHSVFPFNMDPRYPGNTTQTWRMEIVKLLNALVILCRVDMAGNGMNVSVCLCVFLRTSSHQISCLSSIIIYTLGKTWRKEWAAAGRQKCLSAVSLTNWFVELRDVMQSFQYNFSRLHICVVSNYFLLHV